MTMRDRKDRRYFDADGQPRFTNLAFWSPLWVYFAIIIVALVFGLGN